MKKLILILMVVFTIAVTIPGWSPAANGPAGPAPNSGDGVSDGSGFEDPNGPNDEGDGDGGPGPAPNSGDGIPDGPGW